MWLMWRQRPFHSSDVGAGGRKQAHPLLDAGNDGSEISFPTVDSQLPKPDRQSFFVSTFVLLAAGFDLVCGLCLMFNVRSAAPKTQVIV